MPGGSAPEWQVSYARGASNAILLVDPRSPVLQDQAEFFDIFLAELTLNWFVVVGKQDLVDRIVSPETFLPAIWRSVPRLEYSGIAEKVKTEGIMRNFISTYVLPTAKVSSYNPTSHLTVLDRKK